MARVYLDTSFVSACVTDREDVPSAYRRQVSQEWWETQRPSHQVFVSVEVLNELSHPGFPRASAGLSLIADVPLLAVDDEVEGLAHLLVREKVMPAPPVGDAVHVAVSTIHGIAYLLTWNVRHLANPNKLEHLRRICTRVGVMPPQILTPDSLWEQE